MQGASLGPVRQSEPLSLLFKAVLFCKSSVTQIPVGHNPRRITKELETDVKKAGERKAPLPYSTENPVS